MNKEKKPEKKAYVVALPLIESDIQGYRDLNKTRITRAFSERQAVSHVIAGQNRSITGLVMDELDNKFFGAERYALVIPDFISDDTEITRNQEAILMERYVAKFFSELRGGNIRSYLNQAQRILKDF